jgi:hypothetical protein
MQRGQARVSVEDGRERGVRQTDLRSHQSSERAGEGERRMEAHTIGKFSRGETMLAVIVESIPRPEATASILSSVLIIANTLTPA